MSLSSLSFTTFTRHNITETRKATHIAFPLNMTKEVDEYLY
jgi:hypothetical protein